MKDLSLMIWIEFFKLKKSKVFIGSIIFFAFISLMLGLLIFISKHPQIMGSSDILYAKASVFINADWPFFLKIMIQFISMMGMLGFGYAASWIFGREYSDKTAKDMLAMPISRADIVIAKMIVVSLWCILLAAVFFICSIIAGFATNLGNWSNSVFIHSLKLFSITALLTICLSTPVAFLASYSRGYLLPLGFLIFILMFSQLVGVGLPVLAPYFPWAVPGLFGASVGASHLGFASYFIFFLTCFMGLLGTIAWWRYADQT